MRVLALLLTVTMSGPSAGAALCEFACAAQHRDAAVSSGSCHETGSETPAPTVATGHRCHTLTTATESILASVPQATLAAVAVANPWLASPGSGVRDRTAERPHDTSHAPPPSLIPLRI